MAIGDETKDRQICCSFCNKPQSQARRLIAGPGVYICDECIELCMSILEDETNLGNRKPNYVESSSELPKPQEIKKLLDDYVIEIGRAHV